MHALRAGHDPRAAVVAGLAFGAVHWTLLLHWIPGALFAASPGYLLPGLLLGALLVGVSGLQFLALHTLLVDRGHSPVLVLPAVWAGTEFLLAHAGPLAFPWAPLGLAGAGAPEAAGLAELLGVRGLTLWIAALNGALLMLGGRRRLALALLVLLLVPVPWSLHRARSLPLHDLPPVTLVQLEMDRSTLADPQERDRTALAAMERVLGRIPAAETGLVILPEAPFRAGWGEGVVAEGSLEPERLARRWAAELRRPLLMGALVPAEAGGTANAVLLVEPSEAGERFRHEKRRLVPGVEWPRFAAGEGGRTARAGGLEFGVLICFESAFGSEAARLRRAGAELLVNPTNDGWIGRTGLMGASAGHAQHRAHLALRSIETRAGAVRAAIGGELLVVDPIGRVSVLSALGREGAVEVAPRTSAVVPLHARAGDLGGLAGLLLLATLFLAGSGFGAGTSSGRGVSRKLQDG